MNKGLFALIGSFVLNFIHGISADTFAHYFLYLLQAVGSIYAALYYRRKKLNADKNKD